MGGEKYFCTLYFAMIGMVGFTRRSKSPFPNTLS